MSGLAFLVAAFFLLPFGIWVGWRACYAFYTSRHPAPPFVLDLDA